MSTTAHTPSLCESLFQWLIELPVLADGLEERVLPLDVLLLPGGGLLALPLLQRRLRSRSAFNVTNLHSMEAIVSCKDN